MWAQDGLNSIHLPMASEAPKPAGGVGGFEEVGIAKRKTAVEFKGIPAFTQMISLMADAYASSTSRGSGSLEGVRLALERMSTPKTVGANPPVVFVAGPVWHPEKRYFINGIDWSNVIRSASNELIRFQADVTLVEAHDPEELIRMKRSMKGKNTECISEFRATYKIKKGDTFPKIARMFMPGGAKCARAIMRYNNIRDPKTIKNMVGKTIKLPTR